MLGLNVALLLQTVKTLCGIKNSFSPQCLEYDLKTPPLLHAFYQNTLFIYRIKKPTLLDFL